MFRTARRGLRLLRVLLAAAIVLPGLALAGLAWQLREDVWADARRELHRTADALVEYALRNVDAWRITLDRMNALVAGLDDATIRAREAEFHAELSALNESLEHANSAVLLDREGSLLAAATIFPVPRGMDFRDREWMRALAAPDAPDLHFSTIHTGRVNQLRFFSVSRRRTGSANPGHADGFDGVVSLSIDPQALAGGMARLVGDTDQRAALLRPDGYVLARVPQLLPEMSAVAPTPDGEAAMRAREGVAILLTRSRADGVLQLGAIAPVPGHPLVVGIGRAAASIDAEWRAQLRSFLAAGVPVWLVLVLLAWLALSRARDAMRVQIALADEQARRAAAEAAAAAEARFRAIFESRAIGIALLDIASSQVTLANDRLLEMVGQTRADYAARGLDWQRATPAEFLPLDLLALAQGRERGAWDTYEKAYLHADGTRVPVRISSAPLPGAPGQVVVVVEDISAQRDAEARRDMMMREVEHRAKNTLALVQSMLRTGLGAIGGEAREAAEVIQGRVAALARSHSLLAQRHWQSADLGSLLRAELEGFSDAQNRVMLEGDAVALPADVAQGMSMVIHELATNAVKYGALSVPSGRLAVRWTTPQAGRVLRLEWQEQDGPALDAAPPRYGFGSRLIRATVEGQLGGSIAREWQPTGLTCVFTVPLTPAETPAPIAAEAAA